MAENEIYMELGTEEFRDRCISLANSSDFILRLMFAADDRASDGSFKVYAVFSERGRDIFHVPFMRLEGDNPGYRSMTPEVPAMHWYEREMRDMFGLEPEGHPDLRRLIFHEAFPSGSYPLRKDWSIKDADLKEWGEGTVIKEPYQFMKVEGDGIYEIPVGPVHAGIIEPGHFRFSAVGETIFFLEPRLFYTHKGIEKHFERSGFAGGVRLAERVSGTSSFSHSSAYCMAVERMSGIEIPEYAKAVRTLLLELERLYNHIGDIGNMCAGTGLAVGYAKGAVIKERIMQLNERLTGSRFLRGINRIGGIKKEVFLQRDDILSTVEAITGEYREFIELLLTTISHMERLQNAGILSKDIAMKLGATGITARASGIDDDMRKAHPHLLYGSLDFEVGTMPQGDVYARMMVRAKETESSISLIKALLQRKYEGGLSAGLKDAPAFSSALGYTETPRGSVFYWVKADRDGKPLRVKLRSPSYCNWPVVPFAVHGNIVPDFPLCNKSFNLSYSGCDM